MSRRNFSFQGSAALAKEKAIHAYRSDYGYRAPVAHVGDENLSGNQADEDHRKTFSCQNWDSFITGDLVFPTGDLVFPS